MEGDVATAGFFLQSISAHAAQRATKSTIPHDHAIACDVRERLGSTREGKLTKAINDPILDRAYNRYGERSGFIMLNHFWIKGPVDERTKYGNPRLIVKILMIRHTGSAPVVGFHEFAGIMGNMNGIDSSNARWRVA